ncbi:MAG TPA: DUF5054 domain-containing protein [Candidatus Sulfotelmatobacter sp.]|nr:DUF5054 domain-containing protein [Candidatus Sulfotelmatobacter sp.]
MHRRKFLEALLASGGTAWIANASPLDPRTALLQSPPVTQPPPSPEIKQVLIVFKCHFDAGFIDTQANVVHRYFNEFFPKAIETAEHLSRSAGSDRANYTWTTGSWLLYEYLDQASTEQRKKMEQAINSGFIAWHALPFSWQTELMDPSLISGAIAISGSLDQRFGRKTTGAKMTDVPGHTRGLVSPLAAAGVRFLDIGVNDASTPAVLPRLFRWQDPTGAQLVVSYHPSYGTIQIVPGSDLAYAIVMRDDNAGPHTPEEIAATFLNLRTRFPNAEIHATDLTHIADAVYQHADSLPLITQEIGDSWIHGIASDPLKVARYRNLCRLRNGWITGGKIKVGDPTDLKLLRNLLLEAEHTWGTDTKTWLDFDNYVPADLIKMLATKNYKVVQSSWQEKRNDLFAAIDSLPPDLKSEATQAVAGLTATRPQPISWSAISKLELETPHFHIQLDEKTGAIRKLNYKVTNQDWAAPDHPLALFTYQTLSQTDYAAFFKNYVISEEDWAKKDFGKPNIERYGAVSKIWLPSLAQSEISETPQAHKIRTRLEFRKDQLNNTDAASTPIPPATAWPKEIFIDFLLPKSLASVEITVSWFGKLPTRMPEALWFSFNPPVADQKTWSMQKSGQEVSPFDVVEGGNRHMHAISDRISCGQGERSFFIVTRDAPLIALGVQSPLYFTREQPQLDQGVHFNLFNNAWGTNYIMWYSEDMRFRFHLEPYRMSLDT